MNARRAYGGSAVHRDHRQLALAIAVYFLFRSTFLLTRFCAVRKRDSAPDDWGISWHTNEDFSTSTR